jgi:hypothetical protein
MRLVSGECSKHETQVLLLVARMTISFRRDLAPLSRSIIERFTGIQGSAALKALGALETAALIRRVPGDERRPSQIGLRLEPGWDWLTADAPSERVAGNPAQKPTQGSIPTGDTFAPGDRIAPASPGKFNPTRNNIGENDREIPLSLPESLRKYVEGLRPLRKRESEMQAYRELRADYSDEDIAACLDRVLARGIGSGDDRQACHSPLAYLAKAMGEVLGAVETERAKARERAERARREADEARRRLEEESRERREWEAKERAFSRAFPSEERQREAVAEQIRDMPFAPKGIGARTIAIGKWFSELSATEREELLR